LGDTPGTVELLALAPVNIRAAIEAFGSTWKYETKVNEQKTVITASKTKTTDEDFIQTISIFRSILSYCLGGTRIDVSIACMKRRRLHSVPALPLESTSP
jgi:hypothetical protein